mgnify:CR=1 FL=1
MPLPALLIPLAPIIGEAIAIVFGWIFRKAILVFIIGTSIYFLSEFLTPLLTRLLSDYLGINPATLLNSIPSDIWYFTSSFKIGFGVKVIFSALATRFLIRRIPFIG